MSNRPPPAHHHVMVIPRAKIADGYNVTIVTSSGRLTWQVVAAAPVDADDPPPTGMVRVIVAPAQVAP